MADGKRERKQATVTSLPHAARPTSRGDVPPQLSAKAIRTYETQADEEGALETELATIASLLDGKSPEDRRRLLEQLLERETQGDAPKDRAVLDLELAGLARRCRSQEPDESQGLRETEIPAANRTTEIAGMGEGNRPARGNPVRRP